MRVNGVKVRPPAGPAIWATALAVLFFLTVAASPVSATCADTTGKAAVRYLTKAIKARQNCFAKAVKNKTDAIDPADAAELCFAAVSDPDIDESIGKRIDRARKRMRARLTKSCIGVNFTDLGFPGPCDVSNERRVCRAEDGATLNFGHSCTSNAYCGGTGCSVIFDFFSYEDCVVAKTDEVTIGKAGGPGILTFEHPASAGADGLGDDWTNTELGCQRKVAQMSGSMFVSELKARAKCLASNDTAAIDCRAEVNNEGAGTGNRKTDKRILRAHRKVLSGIIGVCPAIDLARLGFPHSCPWPDNSLFTLSALSECMFDGHHLDLIRYLDTLAPPSSKCGNQAVPWAEVLTAGTLDFTEECDAAAANATAVCAQTATAGCGAYCSMDCRAQTCGDINNNGILDGWDSQWLNAAANDPAKRCDLEVCDIDGDGDLDQADVTRLNDYATELFLGLPVTTSLACRCGNGIVEQHEQCDDRGRGFCTGAGGQGDPQQPCYSDLDCSGTVCLKNADSCKAGCIRASCGDGILWVGVEECDDGPDNANLPNKCRSYCMLAMCGDGIVDSGEQCDADGESSSCDSDCTNAVCGDGHINPAAGELCDDSNTLGQDYCATDCSEVTGRCGDAVVQSRLEECDDGESGSTTCDPDCTDTACGDGYVNSAAGEQCDDGGTESGDGCAFNCTTE